MEIMYSNRSFDLFNKDSIIGIYGDKVDLLELGIEFDGINYDDEWTVRKFLNGYRVKISDDILCLFSELEISYSLLKRKIKDLSKGQFKLVLLVYVLLNRKNIIVLDYFDKGLSYKYKKKIINYLKTKYNGILVVISNDIVFLDLLCNDLIIFNSGNIVFDDKLREVYKSKVKIEYPEITKFIRLANKSKAKLSYTVETRELLKDIYRSVR